MKEHGTTTRYSRGKCRCDECRAAVAEYYRNLRARRKAEAKRSVPVSSESYLADLRARFLAVTE